MKNFGKSFLPLLLFAIIAFGSSSPVRASGCTGSCGVTYTIINNLNCPFGFEWMSACHSLTGHTFSVGPASINPGITVPCLTMIPDCPDGCATGFFILGTPIAPPATGTQVWNLPDPDYCNGDCPTGIQVTWTPYPGGGGGTFTINCY